jgi:hypothetical protein
LKKQVSTPKTDDSGMYWKRTNTNDRLYKNLKLRLNPKQRGKIERLIYHIEGMPMRYEHGRCNGEAIKELAWMLAAIQDVIYKDVVEEKKELQSEEASKHPKD